MEKIHWMELNSIPTYRTSLWRGKKHSPEPQFPWDLSIAHLMVSHMFTLRWTEFLALSLFFVAC